MNPSLKMMHSMDSAMRELLASTPFQAGQEAWKTTSNWFADRDDNKKSTSRFFFTWDEMEGSLTALSMPDGRGFLHVEGWLWKTNISIFNQSRSDFRRLAERNDLTLVSNDLVAGISIDHAIHVAPHGTEKDDTIEIHVSHWGIGHAADA